MHTPLAVKALDAGLHVLLEKPISVDLEGSLPVVAASKRHPKQKIMIALSRRCMSQAYLGASPGWMH
jgi:myo-inositol 2-dehydrogenase/D-chiro-inositol 1-dehydrogenase